MGLSLRMSEVPFYIHGIMLVLLFARSSQTLTQLGPRKACWSRGTGIKVGGKKLNRVFFPPASRFVTYKLLAKAALT